MGRLDDVEVSEDERRVMRECVREAFWYRSLPASAFTGLSVNYAIKTGRIKTSPRFGGWPIIFGASSMAYFVSKLSYIFGKNCTNKFLTDAPDSEISVQIRKNRESDQETWKTEHDEQLNKFSDILDKIDFDSLSEKEKMIINDCNSTAFWQFSMPLMLAFSGSIYLAIKKGFLGPSRWNTTFPKSPKMIVGASVGYIAGQYLYVFSKDCSNRFLEYAPEEKMAKLLRGEHSNLQTDQSVASPDDHDGYIIPDYRTECVDTSIKETLEL